MYVAAIIAAGGQGRRLGLSIPKPLVELGGRTILERSVEPFLLSDRVHELVVVLPPELADNPPAWLGRASKPVRVVRGGERRQDSVASGFEIVAARADVIVIHDAARPFVSVDLIARTIDAAADSGAAVAAIAARDTVKEVEPPPPFPGLARVRRTLPRAAIVLTQTPQAFRRDVLRDAIAAGRSGIDATDEAALAERSGHDVRVVEGDARNLKITTPDDLALARALVASEAAQPQTRIGVGYDLHRLVEGRPLVLGGVTIPSDRGLAGHSDADALCHAVTDAILGGARAGDIGQHFPDTDPRWKDASSLELLRRAAGVVSAAGFRVENVDAVVIIERPTLAAYRDQMIEHIAGAIGISPGGVNVKGKTNEGVSALGRGEAVAVHAVALLSRR